MRDSNRHLSILGLLGLVLFAALLILGLQWMSNHWSTRGFQALVLTPLLLLYIFSWTVFVLLAPALVAVSPGIRASAFVRWLLAVLLGSAEYLFAMVWAETDSFFVLLAMGFLFSSVWVGASMALREYFEWG